MTAYVTAFRHSSRAQVFHYYLTEGKRTTRHEAPLNDFEAWLIEYEHADSFKEWIATNVPPATKNAVVHSYHTNNQ